MKKIAIWTILVAGILLNTSTVRADSDKAWAAVGGVLGGVILSNIVHDHHERVHSRNSHHHTEKVIVVKEKSRKHHKHASHGHYEYRKVKEWVPGCVVVRYDECGRRYKVWQKGYYTYRKEKVWVEDVCDHYERPRDRFVGKRYCYSK